MSLAGPKEILRINWGHLTVNGLIYIYMEYKLVFSNKVITKVLGAVS